MKKNLLCLIGTLVLTCLPPSLMAQDTVPSAPDIDSGSTAWMIVACALVLFMTLPGLALFYGGLVRAKNILSVLMHCFVLAAVMSLIWVIGGYSLAFSSGGGLQRFIGGTDFLLLRHLTPTTVNGSIPESVFIMFQMTFVIITPALIVGAFAERMRFDAMLLFTVGWAILSYLPICHMAWGGGLFAEWGVLDFAGGTVVHINAGIAGLVACIVLGKRIGYPNDPIKPHNMPLTVVGACMLWVGWFGFNAGSALAADGTAGMAMLVTHVATATAALTWLVAEWVKHGKPSVLGIVTGAVAGLVAITPASGTSGIPGALLIGVVSGGVCYFTATTMKRKFGYDDSLDVFGVHGIGGIIGALLTGVCAAPVLGGSGLSEGHTIASQVVAQAKSVAVTIVWSAVVSVVVLSLVKVIVGLRVERDIELSGLDLALHDEQGYDL